jgi:hypothetical protein
MTRARDVADTQDNLGGAVPPFLAGKNKIINGDFGVWQRGTSFTLAQGDTYTADRFRTGMSSKSGGTITVSQQTFTPGTAPVAGYESTYFWRIEGTSTPAGLSYLATDHSVEDVRTLAGQTVTFSFWAKSDTNRNVDIGFVQYFGVGGSATLQPTIGTVAVTTSWSRLSVTYTIPSMAGKTITTGSTGVFRVYHPQNVNFTFDMWGVQMEAGSVATPFTTATGTIQGELAACQRYYYRAPNGGNVYPTFSQWGTATSATLLFSSVVTPVTMRIIPTAVEFSNLRVFGQSTGVYNSITAVALDTAGSALNLMLVQLTSSGLTTNAVYGFGGNNSTASHISFSAEL